VNRAQGALGDWKGSEKNSEIKPPIKYNYIIKAGKNSLRILS
jgi:hypothetical protein